VLIFVQFHIIQRRYLVTISSVRSLLLCGIHAVNDNSSFHGWVDDVLVHTPRSRTCPQGKGKYGSMSWALFEQATTVHTWYGRIV